MRGASFGFSGVIEAKVGPVAIASKAKPADPNARGAREVRLVSKHRVLRRTHDPAGRR
jgi:hypothetical protein